MAAWHSGMASHVFHISALLAKACSTPQAPRTTCASHDRWSPVSIPVGKCNSKSSLPDHLVGNVRGSLALPARGQALHLPHVTHLWRLLRHRQQPRHHLKASGLDDGNAHIEQRDLAAARHIAEHSQRGGEHLRRRRVRLNCLHHLQSANGVRWSGSGSPSSPGVICHSINCRASGPTVQSGQCRPARHNVRLTRSTACSPSCTM